MMNQVANPRKNWEAWWIRGNLVVNCLVNLFYWRHCKAKDGLRSLTFGSHFDQSLDDVKLPGSLRHLTFGDHFDQSLDNAILPSSLESLTLGCWFNQDLQNVTWPSNLQCLVLGKEYLLNLNDLILPSSLRCFSVNGTVVSCLSDSARCLDEAWNAKNAASGVVQKAWIFSNWRGTILDL